MQKITTTAAVCLALLPALATPAAAQNREHLQLAAELRMLQEQNQQLSLALNQLTETLKAVNSRLDTSEEFQRRRFADQEVLVKNLGSDLGTIRERTQDTDTRLRSLKDEIDANEPVAVDNYTGIVERNAVALIDGDGFEALNRSAVGSLRIADHQYGSDDGQHQGRDSCQ